MTPTEQWKERQNLLAETIAKRLHNVIHLVPLNERASVIDEAPNSAFAKMRRQHCDNVRLVWTVDMLLPDDELPYFDEAIYSTSRPLRFVIPMGKNAWRLFLTGYWYFVQKVISLVVSHLRDINHSVTIWTAYPTQTLFSTENVADTQYLFVDIAVLGEINSATSSSSSSTATDGQKKRGWLF
jgi:hypothetical protein